MDVAARQAVPLEDAVVKRMPNFAVLDVAAHCENAQEVVQQEENEIIRIER